MRSAALALWLAACGASRRVVYRDAGPPPDAAPGPDASADAGPPGDPGCIDAEVVAVDDPTWVYEALTIDCPPVPEAFVPCGACGDGVVDECKSGSEDCDSAAPADCAAIGYSRGSLACSPYCSWDNAACDECVGAASLSACMRVAGSQAPFAVSQGGGGVVVAWVQSPEAIAFAELDSDFVPLRSPTCLAMTDAWDVALTPFDGEYLLAATTSQGVETLAVNGHGTPQSRVTVHPAAFEILLSSAPGLGAIAVVSTPDGADAIGLEYRGKDVWRERISTYALEVRLGSIVPTTDAYLVAIRDTLDARISVFDLLPDGGVRCLSVASDEASEYPQLAWNGTDARITWAAFGREGVVRWARLDASGRRIGPPVEIMGGSEIYNPARILADGEDTIVLTGSYTGGVDTAQRLAMQRLDANGTNVDGSSEALVYDPELLGGYRILDWNGDALVAWGRGGWPGGIGLARLSR